MRIKCVGRRPRLYSHMKFGVVDALAANIRLVFFVFLHVFSRLRKSAESIYYNFVYRKSGDVITEILLVPLEQNVCAIFDEC